MESVITSEAGTLSAMQFNMSAVDRAFRSELRFCKNRGLPERKEHDRYRQVVRACLLHTSESWGLKLDEGVGGRVAWLEEQVLGDE